MRIDGVFSGGGVKAYAFLGALKSIEENDLQLDRVAGTSAGAIIASLIAAKYTTEEINDLIDTLDLTYFLDAPIITKIIPFSKWFFLYFQKGLYKGDLFEKWLAKQLALKNVYTFNDLEQGSLKVIVSDLTLGKLVVIPDDLERVYQINPAHFSIAKAVRMSAGFPYFFMPKTIEGKNKQKSIVVDGGLLSNFPLWVFEDRHGVKKRPILGVKLSSANEEIPSRKINNALDMFPALFTTMMIAHDARYISKTKQNNIIFIPIKGVNSVNLQIKAEEKEHLYQLGKIAADEFLTGWPK